MCDGSCLLGVAPSQGIEKGSWKKTLENIKMILDENKTKPISDHYQSLCLMFNWKTAVIFDSEIYKFTLFA